MADTKTAKHVVTNITGGPKVLNCMSPGILAAGDRGRICSGQGDGLVQVRRRGQG
jgi:hypothetical protein